MGADQCAGRPAVAPGSAASIRPSTRASPSSPAVSRAETGDAHAGIRQPATEAGDQDNEACRAERAMGKGDDPMRRLRFRSPHIEYRQPGADQIAADKM